LIAANSASANTAIDTLRWRDEFFKITSLTFVPAILPWDSWLNLLVEPVPGIRLTPLRD
jgi:hypothetical protein